MQVNSQGFEAAVQQTLQALRDHQITERIWARDHTVWREDPKEITNRLGWLDVADRYLSEVESLEAFAAEVIAEGFKNVLLLGMGGSSLAPEVLSKTFGVAADGLALSVLDSTDPEAVLEYARTMDPGRTLFIVSTKSGSTVETLSFFKYFYNFTAENLGTDTAGRHFVAITDPGSKLVGLAEKFGFRKTFLNDPEIGGRYSALSLVGLVPAALLGMHPGRLLERAIREAAASHTPESDGARLGAVIGTLARQGKDKLTLMTSAPIESIGDWVEQLVAESTGKQGRGILPVVGETYGGTEVYGSDRLFVGISLGEDQALAAKLDALESAGHPVVRLQMDDRYDLGAQFFLWEFATAVAGHVIDIQPFNQPNVESAKVRARNMADEYQRTGELPEIDEIPPMPEHLLRFLEGAAPGEYVAIQAFVRPEPETDVALQTLRQAIRAHTSCAVTVGYGPRFLHSTGQLHKGDAGNGRFIQFVSTSPHDLPIPDEAGMWDAQMSFEILKRSQALGDYQALREADPPRSVIRFKTGEDTAGTLRGFVDSFKQSGGNSG